MLDVRSSLRKYGLKFAGRRLDVAMWRRLAQEIISSNLKKIAPEFTIGDLYEIVRADGLIVELSNGYIAISPALWTDVDWAHINERLWQGEKGVELGGLGCLFVVSVIERLQPIGYEQLYDLAYAESPVDLSGMGLVSLLEVLIKKGALINENQSNQFAENGKYFLSKLGKSVIQELKIKLSYISLDTLEQRIERACRIAQGEQLESHKRAQRRIGETKCLK